MSLSASASLTAAADLAEQAGAIYPGLEKTYTDLHRHPELALHETHTSAELARRVKALGDEVTAGSKPL